MDVISNVMSYVVVVLLEVKSSWADIVKFGQTKPQPEAAAKRANTRVKVAKRAVAPKPQVTEYCGFLSLRFQVFLSKTMVLNNRTSQVWAQQHPFCPSY